MKSDLRKSGIEIVGDIPWGTHLCQFYQGKEDLIETLVPYFKEGLENNEFCMWIAAESLNVEDVKSVLKEKVKDLDDYIKKRQIEILDYSQWYTKTGSFDAATVLEGWVEKEKQAIERGFDGLRLTGNTFWLEKKDWDSFTDYEAVVNSVLGKHRMLAICSYSLDKCQAAEIIEVINNHQFALIKEKGEWVLLESSERKRAEKMFDKVNKCFLTFGHNPDENIRKIVETTGSILEGVCALYNKEESTFLCTVEGWNIPKDFKRKDSKEGHICYDVITKYIDEPFVINELDKTLYAKSDPNVTQYKLKTYIGCVVKIRDKIIGSLCVIYQKNRIFNSNELNILSVLAKALGIEEERKQAEEALWESEEIFKQFMENSPIYVFFKNDKIQAIRLSNNYEKMLGKPMHDLLGKTMNDLFPSDLAKSMIADDLRILNEGKQITVEEELDGRFYTTTKFPIHYEGKPRYLAGYTIDITERKRREEELKKAYVDLKEMQERLILSEKLSTRGELAAGIAHEIRNPLSVISMTVQYLQSKFEANDPRREYTESIIQKVERLDRIARGLTDYSKSPQLNIKNRNLTRILLETISLIKPKCRINKIKIIQKLMKVLPLAPIDEEKIDQVFLNIINNAIEAMPKGGKLYIETGYNEETKEITIKIKDTGKGLTSKSIKNIFNPFFTTKKAEGGVGLGLSISHNIIISHNGTIDVESKIKGKDKGANFIIKLPVDALSQEHYGDNK